MITIRAIVFLLSAFLEPGAPRELPKSDRAPELVLQLGHRALPTRLAVSPDGRQLATGSRGNTVLLWDVATGRQLGSFGNWDEGNHENPISSLAFSPDGRRLLIGTISEVQVWDKLTGSPIFKLDVNHFATSGVYVANTGVFSPDGRLIALACGTGQSVLEQKGRGEVLLYDASTGRFLRSMGGFSQDAVSVSFSPDSKSVLAAAADGTASHWKVEGTREWTVTLGEGFPFGGAGVFSPDGSKVLISSFRRAAIYDSKSGTHVCAMHVPDKTLVLSAVFSPDGKTVFLGCDPRDVAKGHVSEWDAMTGQRIRTVGEVQFERARHDLVLGPGGGLLFASDWSVESPQVKVWERESGKLFRTLPCRDHKLANQSWAAFTPNGKGLVTADYGYRRPSPRDDYMTVGRFTVWNLERAQIQSSFPTPYGPTESYAAGALTPDASRVVTVGQKDAAVFDLKSGKELFQLKGHEERITSIAVSPDGLTIAAGSYDAIVRTWDATTGEAKAVLKGFDRPVTPAWPLAVQSLSFSADSRRLLAGAGANDAVIFDLKTETVVRKFIQPKRSDSLTVFDRNSAAQSLDGRHVFTNDVGKSDPSQGFLWDAQTGDLLRTLIVPGEYSKILCAAFQPASRILATGGADKMARLWDVNTGRELRILRGHTGTVWGICFSPDGKRLATSSGDGTVILWETDSGRPLGMLIHSQEGESLALCSQGYYHGSSEGQQFVSWRIDGAVFPVELYENRFHRADLVSRILLGQKVEGLATVSGKTKPPRTELTVGKPEGRRVKFSVKATPDPSAKITAVRVFIDGRDLRTETTREDKGGSAFYHGEVDFPPGKTIAVIAATATDDLGYRSVPDVVTLVLPGAAGPVERNLFVMAVGVSQHQDPSRNLQYAHADAVELGKTLQVQQGRAFQKVSAKVLVNEQATTDNIRQGLKWLSDNVSQADTVVVQFSGHAGRDGNGRLFYLSHDSTFPWDEVALALKQVPAASVLFLSDCCHSGAFGQQAATQEALAETLLREARVMVFAASRETEFSLELANLKHGAFTYAVLEGLRGKADLIPDGRITISELQTYVANQVKQLTGDRQHPHIPRMNDFDPETVLAHTQ